MRKSLFLISNQNNVNEVKETVGKLLIHETDAVRARVCTRTCTRLPVPGKVQENTHAHRLLGETI